MGYQSPHATCRWVPRQAEGSAEGHICSFSLPKSSQPYTLVRACQESSARVTGCCQQWPHVTPRAAVQGHPLHTLQQLHTLSRNASQTSVGCGYLNQNHGPLLESVMKTRSFLRALFNWSNNIYSWTLHRHPPSHRGDTGYSLRLGWCHSRLSRSFSSSSAWNPGCFLSQALLSNVLSKVSLSVN